MKKKLVFHFFILKNWRENPIYDIHFKCLKYYNSCFDEAYFVLSLEDPDDLESLYEVKQKLFDIFKDTNKIKFKTVENTIFRESKTFKEEIVDKLGEDDLVFFGHTKGITNLNTLGFELTKDWIYGLYYFSLNDMNEIETHLCSDPNSISYGSLLTIFDYEGPRVINKYEWYYTGTFFWINTKTLKNYIKNNNIELPELSNRYYSENFLGNIYSVYLYNKITAAHSIYQLEWYANEANVTDLGDMLKFLTQWDSVKEDYNKFLQRISIE